MFDTATKNHKKKILTTLLVVSVISVLVFLYKDYPPVSFFTGIVQSVFDSPRNIFYSLGKSERRDEINQLKDEIRMLQEKIVDYQTIKSDNEALRNQFDENGQTTRSLTSAKVIGFIGENKKPQELTINAGKNNNIQKGMTVIVGEYLVGMVETVSENYASVTTPFNNKFQVLAKFSETDANGIVVGKEDLLLFDGVVITDELKEGGLVVTKGEVDSNGVGVVPDIIIGKISSISKRETAPFQNAQLEPLVDYTKLTNVFVITRM